MTTFTGCSGDDAVTSDKDVVTLPGVESIVGTWREDSEYGINILTVNEDSSYALYHTSGGKESGKGSAFMMNRENCGQDFRIWQSTQKILHPS